jgi:hypothetical protein
MNWLFKIILPSFLVACLFASPKSPLFLKFLGMDNFGTVFCVVGVVLLIILRNDKTLDLWP